MDKKLKIDCVSLKASKLLPLVVKQGRFLTASLRQFSSRFFSKAERETVTRTDCLCQREFILDIFQVRGNVFLQFRRFDNFNIIKQSHYKTAYAIVRTDFGFKYPLVIG